jgi:hypothetical protein
MHTRHAYAPEAAVKELSVQPAIGKLHAQKTVLSYPTGMTVDCLRGMATSRDRAPCAFPFVRLSQTNRAISSGFHCALTTNDEVDNPFMVFTQLANCFNSLATHLILHRAIVLLFTNHRAFTYAFLPSFTGAFQSPLPFRRIVTNRLAMRCHRFIT